MREIFQSESDDRAVFAGEFGDVGDGADGHNLQKCRNLRLAAAFAKQGVDEFERDADTREVFVRIIAAFLVRIEHGKGWWSAFCLVGEMVIGDDYVETVVVGPVKRLVRSYAAVDTHD